MPINLMTLNNFFGVDLRPNEVAGFIAGRAAQESYPNPANFEEKAVSLVGRELYEAFIRGYTAKQWETDPKLLPAEVISRLPVRHNYNDFYFDDIYERPAAGPATTRSSNASTRTNASRSSSAATSSTCCPQLRPDATVIYTGPIDRWFDYRFSPIGWRTLDFETERPKVDDWQGASVENVPGCL